jgi:hypothetical protein
MNFNEFKKNLRANANFSITNRLDEIIVKDYLPDYKKKVIFRFRFINVFAGLIILGLISFLSYLSFNPITTLTIDINPEIEIELNIFNRVVSVEAMNQDGEQFIEELNIKLKTVEKATNLIYENGLENNYDYNGQLYVLYGVYSSKPKTTEAIQFKLNLSNLENIKTIIISEVVDEPNNLETNYQVSPSISFDEGARSDSDDYDYKSAITMSELLSDYQGSNTRLNLVVKIFTENDLFTTYNDFQYLLSLELHQLFELNND